MSPPISKTAYNKTVKKFLNASCNCAEQSMIDAASSELKLTENAGPYKEVTVSGDGTWKTRGHSSLIGVCTLLGAISGKVLDIEVLSSRCRGCESWKGPRKGALYEEWFKNHATVCDKNHTGSAGLMEVVGMNRIFQRSESKRKVR